MKKISKFEPRISLMTLGVNDLKKVLAADVGTPAKGSGFRGMTPGHNVRDKADVAVILALAKKKRVVKL